MKVDDLLRLVGPEGRDRLASLTREALDDLAIRIQYDGYIQRQLADVRRHQATETATIPDDLDFHALEGITIEARDKLSRLRPATLGQASRIAGVSPADVSVLMVHLHRRTAQAGPAPLAGPGDSAPAGDGAAGAVRAGSAGPRGR